MNEQAHAPGTVAAVAPETIGHILDLARWAPSGDNTQPWRVRRVGAAIELLLDPEPAFLDVEGTASLMALGAFAESCLLAGTRAGCAARLVEVPAQTRGLAAVLELGSGTGSADPLAEHLEHRVSNRRLYEAGALAEADASAISRSVDPVPGVELRWVRGPGLDPLARGIALCDRVRMEHKLCHQEFHQKVHWTEDAARQSMRGFYVGTFEVKPHERLMLRVTRSTAIMWLMNTVFRMSSIAAAVGRRQVLSSGAVGILRAESWEPAHLVQAGRALQRAWLQATALGLGFQVLGVAPLFVHRLELDNTGFSPRQTKKVSRSQGILSTIPELSPLSRVVLMFRVGHALPPSARTFRLPPESLLVGEGGRA